MSTLIYLHGFLSSPLSAKAQQLAQWLSQHRPDVRYECPQLPPYPDECAAIIERTIEEAIVSADGPVFLMGSSMGGFWASWFSEKYNVKCVQINPAVDVIGLMPAYLHSELQNYHNQETYYLTKQHLQQLRRYCLEGPQQKSNYWLLLQTGDETLDYRLAVDHYQGCRMTIEEGGDHSFQQFERFIPDTIAFFEAPQP